MRVIHVINSLGVGGAERQLLLISSEMQRRGVKQLIVPLVSDTEAQSLPQGIDGFSARKGFPSVFPAFAFVFQEMRKCEEVILVAWMYHSWVFALFFKVLFRRKVKLFLYCRHGNVDSLKAHTRALSAISLKAASWLKVPVVYNSRSAMNGHAKLAVDVQQYVIPNGMLEPRARIVDRSPTIRTVAFLGRNHPDKGADVLPEIVACVLRGDRDVKFIVAGPGISLLREEIVAKVRAAGCDPSRVSVLDTITDTSVFFSQVDLIVVPSRAESFPNVVLEAISFGVLVASTNVGEIPEILGASVSAVEKPIDVAALALDLILLRPADVERIRMDLFKAANKRFGIEAVAKAHLQLWRDYVE